MHNVSSHVWCEHVLPAARPQPPSQEEAHQLRGKLSIAAVHDIRYRRDIIDWYKNRLKSSSDLFDLDTTFILAEDRQNASASTSAICSLSSRICYCSTISKSSTSWAIYPFPDPDHRFWDMELEGQCYRSSLPCHQRRLQTHRLCSHIWKRGNTELSSLLQDTP